MGMGQKTEIKQPEQLLPNVIAPMDGRPVSVSKEPIEKQAGYLAQAFEKSCPVRTSSTTPLRALLKPGCSV